jgi:hypothetical protein
MKRIPMDFKIIYWTNVLSSGQRNPLPSSVGSFFYLVIAYYYKKNEQFQNYLLQDMNLF